MKKPAWINTLLKVFIKSVSWISLKTKIPQTFTYKCANSDGLWEIQIFPWLHEIYGGKYDGDLHIPSFEIDLLPIVKEFKKIYSINFNTDSFETYIEGEIKDCYVNLIICSYPPDSKTYKKLNTFTGEVTKIQP